MYEHYHGTEEYKDGQAAQAYYGDQPVHEMQDPRQTYGTTHELPVRGVQ
jgi:hypothetical protein